MKKYFRKLHWVAILSFILTLWITGCTTQLTVINSDGSGVVTRRFELTDAQVQSGALAACQSLIPDPIFSASIETSGATTWCVHTAAFANLNALAQIYATIPGVTIQQLDMQNHRITHDLLLTPPSSPANLATNVWQVQFPGALIAHNASSVEDKKLGWESANGCNNQRLFAQSLDGQTLPFSVFFPIFQTHVTPPLAIQSVRDLGTLGHPVSVGARDVGASTMVGRCILWMFGDTLFNPQSVDGTHLRSSTAGLAHPDNPLNPIEPLDANGAPYEFLPFTSDEIAYNQNPNYPNERIALWVESAVWTRDGAALVYYSKLKVHPGDFNYEAIGTGIARVPSGSVSATRDPNLLFNAPEPAFLSAFAHGAYVYVYGCRQEGWLYLPCYVARVPLAQARTRTAYQFWNGATWVSDLSQAAHVFEGAWSGLTVSWNSYLGKFLLVYSKLFSNDVLMQTAPSPAGPWSAPIVAFTGLIPAAGTNDYTAREHPELSSNNGRRLTVTYYRPTGWLTGELRVVELNLY